MPPRGFLYTTPFAELVRSFPVVLFNVFQYFYQTFRQIFVAKHLPGSQNYIAVSDMSLIIVSLHMVYFYTGAVGKLRNLRNLTVTSDISLYSVLFKWITLYSRYSNQKLFQKLCGTTILRYTSLIENAIKADFLKSAPITG